MTPTTPTTTGAPEPQRIACGLDDPCLFTPATWTTPTWRDSPRPTPRPTGRCTQAACSSPVSPPKSAGRSTQLHPYRPGPWAGV